MKKVNNLEARYQKSTVKHLVFAAPNLEDFEDKSMRSYTACKELITYLC